MKHTKRRLLAMAPVLAIDVDTANVRRSLKTAGCDLWASKPGSAELLAQRGFQQ